MQVLVFLLVASATVRSASAATACPPAPTVTTTLCECATPNTDDCAVGKVCNAGNPKVCADPPQGGGGGAPSGTAPAAPLRCQNKDGSLLPSATICEDKLDKATCDARADKAGKADKEAKEEDREVRAEDREVKEEDKEVKEEDREAKEEDREDKEAKEEARQLQEDNARTNLSDLALNCAKTCKVCCETAEYGCEDDTSFGIDCQQQKSKCKIAQWTSVMSTACPLTCGLCNAGACKDTIAGCGSLKTLCRDFTYRTYMSTNCARTCQACNNNGGGAVVPPAADCVDTGVNCGGYTSWCTGPADQQNIMRTSCKKTCGFC
ncbi:Metridin-like ShK toxin [Aphelenchoides avenae]|nr:Metridin-like ShK toxin [Aphelenchus avenae]